MKRRFSGEQIILMIKEQESGAPTKDLCRKHGISEASFYRYKSKYGGMGASMQHDLVNFQGERHVFE